MRWQFTFLVIFLFLGTIILTGCEEQAGQVFRVVSKHKCAENIDKVCKGETLKVSTRHTNCRISMSSVECDVACGKIQGETKCLTDEEYMMLLENRGDAKADQMPTCDDSDGGSNIYEKGTLEVWTPTRGAFSVVEFCANSDGTNNSAGSYVEELVCLEDDPQHAYKHMRTMCDSGCNDGACQRLAPIEEGELSFQNTATAYISCDPGWSCINNPAEFAAACEDEGNTPELRCSATDQYCKIPTSPFPSSSTSLSAGGTVVSASVSASKAGSGERSIHDLTVSSQVRKEDPSDLALIKGTPKATEGMGLIDYSKLSGTDSATSRDAYYSTGHDKVYSESGVILMRKAPTADDSAGIAAQDVFVMSATSKDSGVLDTSTAAEGTKTAVVVRDSVGMDMVTARASSSVVSDKTAVKTSSTVSAYATTTKDVSPTVLSSTSYKSGLDSTNGCCARCRVIESSYLAVSEPVVTKSATPLAPCDESDGYTCIAKGVLPMYDTYTCDSKGYSESGSCTVSDESGKCVKCRTSGLVPKDASSESATSTGIVAKDTTTRSLLSIRAVEGADIDCEDAFGPRSSCVATELEFQEECYGRGQRYLDGPACVTDHDAVGYCVTCED